MPKRIKNKKLVKRKPKKKVMRIPRILVKGMPAHKAMATFVYSGYATINQSTFNAAYGQFQCNSIYDPEITLQWRSNISNNRNRQPRYRDAIMGQLYRRYSVLSSNLELTFASTSADTDDDARAYVYTVGNGDGGGDIRPDNPGLINEHPWVKLNGQVKELGGIRGSHSKVKLNASWSLSGQDLIDKINNETQYDSAPSTYVPYFQFGLANAGNNLGTATDTKMFYTMTFNVLLSDPQYTISD